MKLKVLLFFCLLGLFGGVAAGQVLAVSSGCGITGGTITISGTLYNRFPITTVASGNYNVGPSDCGHTIAMGGSSPTVNLPIVNINYPNGWMMFLSFQGSGTLTILPQGGSTIDGNSSATLTAGAGAGMQIWSTGANWMSFRTGPGATPAGVATSVVSATANPASSGTVRLANGDKVCWRNYENSADTCLYDSFDAMRLDDINFVANGYYGGNFVDNAANPAASGTFRLSHGNKVCWRNNANGADICLSLDSGDNITAATYKAGAFLSTGGTNASAGLLRMQTLDTLNWRNHANSADLALAHSDTTTDAFNVNGPWGSTRPATAFGSTNQTLTAAIMLGGIVTGTPTGPANYTTDTAANIVAGIAACVVGTTYPMSIVNTSGGAYTITVRAGSNVTLSGTMTIAQNAERQFLMTVTNCTASSEAVTLYDTTGASSGGSGTVTSIATTSPITGGTITTTGTIACATCVTSGSSLTSNALMTGAGSQASQTVTTGTGVVTALGVNTGSAGAFVVNGGALGTPSSGTLTNATGLPVAGHSAQAADTVDMNATGGSASPTAVAMPTCTSGADLYNTSTHTWSCVATSSSVVLIDSETLSASQIKALGTGGSALALSGALGTVPGSGKFYEITGIVVEYVCSACTAMSGAGHFGLSYDTGGNYDPLREGSGQYPGVDGMLGSTTAGLGKYYSNENIANSGYWSGASNVVNQKLYFVNGGSAFTTGTGSLIIDISYVIHSGF